MTDQRSHRPVAAAAGGGADAAGDLFVFRDVGVDAPDGTPILHGVSFTVPDRGITVVVGPSGAGKSTLLRLCNRLAVVARGRLLLRGVDVACIDPLTLRRRVGMVFQRPTMLGGTVRDNLLLAAPDAPASTLHRALEQAALDASVLDREADTLSGGEAQRVSLARTLVADPEVLLLDEPTSALDAPPREAFERVAVGLARDGIPMLWVTHDLGQAQRMADQVVVLADGRVAFTGSVDAFRADRTAQGIVGGAGADGGRQTGDEDPHDASASAARTTSGHEEVNRGAG